MDGDYTWEGVSTLYINVLRIELRGNGCPSNHHTLLRLSRFGRSQRVHPKLIRSITAMIAAPTNQPTTSAMLPGRGCQFILRGIVINAPLRAFPWKHTTSPYNTQNQRNSTAGLSPTIYTMTYPFTYTPCLYMHTRGRSRYKPTYSPQPSPAYTA